MITAKIKKYKRWAESLTKNAMLSVLNEVRISKEERESITLTEIEHKTNKEAACIMGIEPRQFDRHLLRARKKMLKQLFPRRKIDIKPS